MYIYNQGYVIKIRIISFMTGLIPAGLVLVFAGFLSPANAATFTFEECSQITTCCAPYVDNPDTEDNDYMQDLCCGQNDGSTRFYHCWQVCAFKNSSSTYCAPQEMGGGGVQPCDPGYGYNTTELWCEECPDGTYSKWVEGEDEYGDTFENYICTLCPKYGTFYTSTDGWGNGLSIFDCHVPVDNEFTNSYGKYEFEPACYYSQ